MLVVFLIERGSNTTVRLPTTQSMDGRSSCKPRSSVDRWGLCLQHVDTSHDTSTGCCFECTSGLDAFSGSARLFLRGHFPRVDNSLFWKLGGTGRAPTGWNGWVTLLVDGIDNDGSWCISPRTTSHIRWIFRLWWNWLGSHVPEVSVLTNTRYA